MFEGNTTRLRTPEYEVRQIPLNKGMDLVTDPRALSPGEISSGDGFLFTEQGIKSGPALRYTNAAESYVGTATQSMLAYFFELDGTEWDIFTYTNGETWVRKNRSNELKLANALSVKDKSKVSFARTMAPGTSILTSQTTTSTGTETSLNCTGVYAAGGLAGKILKITSGDNVDQTYLILTNTVDTIYIDGRFNSAIPSGITFNVYNISQAIILNVRGNDLMMIVGNTISTITKYAGSRFYSVASYKGRVFLAKQTVPTQVIFSSPGVATFPDLNYFTIQGAESTSLQPSDDRMIMFSTNGRHYLSGDSPDNFSVSYGGYETTDANRQTHIYASGSVFFVSDRGLENANALDSVAIGDVIPYSSKITRPGSASLFGYAPKYGMSLNNKDLRIAVGNNRLWLFVCDANADTTIAYVLDLGLTVKTGKPTWTKTSFSALPYVTYAAFDDVNQRIVICVRNVALFLDETRTNSETALQTASGMYSFRLGVLNFEDYGRPQNVYKFRIRAAVKGTYILSLAAYDRYGSIIAAQSINVSEVDLTEKMFELYINKRINGAELSVDKTTSSTNDVFEPYVLESFTTAQPKPK